MTTEELKDQDRFEGNEKQLKEKANNKLVRMITLLGQLVDSDGYYNTSTYESRKRKGEFVHTPENELLLKAADVIKSNSMAAKLAAGILTTAVILPVAATVTGLAYVVEQISDIVSDVISSFSGDDDEAVQQMDVDQAMGEVEADIERDNESIKNFGLSDVEKSIVDEKTTVVKADTLGDMISIIMKSDVESANKAGVKYGLGSATFSGKQYNAIDCSGFVNVLLNNLAKGSGETLSEAEKNLALMSNDDKYQRKSSFTLIDTYGKSGKLIKPDGTKSDFEATTSRDPKDGVTDWERRNYGGFFKVLNGAPWSAESAKKNLYPGDVIFNHNVADFRPDRKTGGLRRIHHIGMAYYDDDVNRMRIAESAGSGPRKSDIDTFWRGSGSKRNFYVARLFDANRKLPGPVSITTPSHIKLGLGGLLENAEILSKQVNVIAGEAGKEVLIDMDDLGIGFILDTIGEAKLKYDASRKEDMLSFIDEKLMPEYRNMIAILSEGKQYA